MLMLPQTAIEILAAGGGLRMSAEGLFPQIMEQMAAAAARGGARLEFVVGDTVLLPQTMTSVGAIGRGNVLFDVR